MDSSRQQEQKKKTTTHQYNEKESTRINNHVLFSLRREENKTGVYNTNIE